MAHQDIRRHTCHDITEKSSADTCDGAKEHQQESIIHISMGDPCIHTYHSKDSKPD